MKKFIKVSCMLFALISCSFLFIGCSNTMSVEFVNIDRIQNQSDDNFCLDFMIKFDNKTNEDKNVLKSDFYIEINNIYYGDIAMLEEYEEVYHLGHYTAKSHEKSNIRIRVVSKIKTGDHNSILIKYKDKIIIEDSVYISKTK